MAIVGVEGVVGWTCEEDCGVTGVIFLFRILAKRLAAKTTPRAAKANALTLAGGDRRSLGAFVTVTVTVSLALFPLVS